MSQVANILGDEARAADYLRKCIYSVGLGSNDYLNNYFMPQYYSTSRQFTPEEYADNLIGQYSQGLRVSSYAPRNVVDLVNFPFSNLVFPCISHFPECFVSRVRFIVVVGQFVHFQDFLNPTCAVVCGVLTVDAVQLWSKEGGSDRSGSNRMQPK